MNTLDFKLPKIKKMEVDPYLSEQIVCHAMLLGLYDTNFEEDNQCSGFYHFKALVSSDLPPLEHLDDQGQFKMYAAQLGYQSLNGLHPLLRRPALKSAMGLRNLLKTN